MTIQIGLYGIDSFAPILLKIRPLGPYIGPNEPRGCIFALGNMCFHKPGSDRDLWVQLKFCHQWGARGPLLPTRLYGLRCRGWCCHSGTALDGDGRMVDSIRAVPVHYIPPKHRPNLSKAMLVNGPPTIHPFEVSTSRNMIVHQSSVMPYHRAISQEMFNKYSLLWG